jgi:hypothetical protein
LAGPTSHQRFSLVCSCSSIIHLSTQAVYPFSSRDSCFEHGARYGQRPGHMQTMGTHRYALTAHLGLVVLCYSYACCSVSQPSLDSLICCPALYYTIYCLLNCTGILIGTDRYFWKRRFAGAGRFRLKKVFFSSPLAVSWSYVNTSPSSLFS